MMNDVIFEYLNRCARAFVEEYEKANDIQLSKSVKESFEYWFMLGADTMRNYIIETLKDE